ncbi:PaaI family thioesterase [Sulfitobacter sp. F26204]|uniref:PaaI family thioesterase n=1 Tax=Sulfitobacter sp. F26204 TaxID=2996014 RepID=UPI00225DF238|nr:PaaI family thioesterase [Sulfitobacter sp. F26204]MCX7560445.1 PaaI family thioesterase [Sulfitobacter sp. F26204]
MSEASKTLPPHEAPESGAELLVGYRINLADPSGLATVTLDIDAKHRNRNGTLHGGIHAMMLDAAAGFAASRFMAGDGLLVPVVTLSLTTNYVAAIADGRVVATGRVTGGGYKIVYATAEITDAGGQVLSSASGVFKRAAK